jgi:hypothetical protein
MITVETWQIFQSSMQFARSEFQRGTNDKFCAKLIFGQVVAKPSSTQFATVSKS